MTVKELIEELQKMPEDAIVYTENHEYGCYDALTFVWKESNGVELSFQDSLKDELKKRGKNNG